MAIGGLGHYGVQVALWSGSPLEPDGAASGQGRGGLGRHGVPVADDIRGLVVVRADETVRCCLALSVLQSEESEAQGISLAVSR